MKIKIKKAELKYGLKVPKRLHTYDDSTRVLIVNGCGYRFVIVYAYLFC